RRRLVQTKRGLRRKGRVLAQKSGWMDGRPRAAPHYSTGPMTVSQRLHERCGCGAAKSTFSLAGTERKYERSRPYRLEHLFIDLTLDFETKSVRGRAVLDFQRVSPKESSLLVDAIGFELESVRVDDGSGLKPASYSYDGEVLTLEGLPERGKLRIDYKATPKRGL